MPARMSIQADTKPLDGYGALLKNAQKANRQIVTQTVKRHEARYLKPMRDLDPGPSKHGAQKGAWSTDPAADARARRWWWYAVKKRIVPSNPITGAYLRTGRLNRQWRLTQRADRLSLENTSESGSYVFSFARNVRARGGRPNPGHIRTGWPQEGRRVATLVLDAIVEDVQIGWSKSIAASVAAGSYKVVVP